MWNPCLDTLNISSVTEMPMVHLLGWDSRFPMDVNSESEGYE